MAQITVQTVSLTGLNPTFVAATAGGDTVDPGDRTWLHVKNGSAAAVTVTITTPGDVSGLAIADLAVSVPAGGERLIGPLTASLFATTGGLASVAYSAAASVTVAACRI